MLDILAVSAHPDDCELFMGGTLLKMKELKYKIGICDLSKGENSTYGSVDTRLEEIKNASVMLGLDERITLDIEDGNIKNNLENRLKVIEVIRKLRPRLVFSFYTQKMRHPDHYHCGQLVSECCFYSGLERIKTNSSAFRPDMFVGFPELIFQSPTFVVDITDFWQQRQKVIECYSSQVITPGQDHGNTKTFIRSNRLWEIQEARGVMAGALIGVKYGEPFFCDYPPKVTDPIKSFERDLF
jgi:bacillithiol biosynthesis deacetylase BshB1